MLSSCSGDISCFFAFVTRVSFIFLFFQVIILYYCHTQHASFRIYYVQPPQTRSTRHAPKKWIPNDEWHSLWLGDGFTNPYSMGNWGLKELRSYFLGVKLFRILLIMQIHDYLISFLLSSAMNEFALALNSGRSLLVCRFLFDLKPSTSCYVVLRQGPLMQVCQLEKRPGLGGHVETSTKKPPSRFKHYLTFDMNSFSWTYSQPITPWLSYLLPSCNICNLCMVYILKDKVDITHALYFLKLSRTFMPSFQSYHEERCFKYMLHFNLRSSALGRCTCLQLDFLGCLVATANLSFDLVPCLFFLLKNVYSGLLLGALCNSEDTRTRYRM